MTVRALYVDDHQGFLDLMEFSTEDMDIEIDTVQDPREVEEMLEQNQFDYDAVVSDYKMGTINGDELYESIREYEPDIPFFFHSSKTQSEIAVNEPEQCITEYLEKASVPDDYKEIAEHVMNCSKT